MGCSISAPPKPASDDFLLSSNVSIARSSMMLDYVDIDDDDASFPEVYSAYLVKDWKEHYISYQSLKDVCLQMKESANSDDLLAKFFGTFLIDLDRLQIFVRSMLQEINDDLATLQSDWDAVLDKDRFRIEERSGSRSFERSIRTVYEKSNQSFSFYKLNHYLVLKLSKKIDKIIAFKNLETKLFYREEVAEQIRNFDDCAAAINMRNEKIVKFYEICFRTSFAELARGELDYLKSVEDVSSSQRLFFGIKIGVIIVLIASIFLDSTVNQYPGQKNNFFENPGLYVFTSIGMVLLFQLTWAVNVWAWSVHDIDYITLFQMHNLKPNTLQIMVSYPDCFCF